MEGKLIKTGDQFLLRNKEDEVIAITSGTMEGRMLSLKNCQAIENGYEFDEYQEGVFYAGNFGHPSPEGFSGEQVGRLHGFIDGFQKALEILGDKKFSEEDIKKTLYLKNGFDKDGFSFYKSDEEIIQSLQQTEWDVEIVMEKCGYCEGCNKAGMLHCAHADSCGFPIETERPKLDADGCLILKRK